LQESALPSSTPTTLSVVVQSTSTSTCQQTKRLDSRC